MSDAMSGYGTIVEVEDDSVTGGWFKLGEVNNIDPPDDTVEDIDVTHYESPGRRREFIAGMIEGGEGTIAINWIPGNATDVYVREWKADGDTRTLRFTYPNNQFESFPAYPKGMTKAVPLDDKMTAELSVKMAGDVAYGTIS